MNDDLHAGLLVLVTGALLGAAQWAASRSKERPVTRSRRGLVIVAILALLAVAASGLHMCLEGQPVRQTLLFSAVYWAILWRVPPGGARMGLLAGCLAGLFVLMQHYNVLVHSRDYTGNPEIVSHRLEPSGRATFVWHTWLTGIYEMRRS